MMDKPRTVLLTLSFVFAVAAWSVPALALWSDDAAVNLAIADGPGEQVLPKLAVTSDGGCYIGWFNNASGSYRVHLQRLDRFGNELWPHNGILVSAHPQSTSLVDWDLDADASDHAVLTFTDTRAGDDLDVYAYRIDPAGAFEWGPDGVTLSANAEYEPSPQCAALPDGDTVFIWPRIPDTGVGEILIQKVSPEGALLFNPPISIPGQPPSERPAFCNVVAADNGGFVADWIRDIRTFSSPRHLWAQKFAADGSPAWPGPVIIYDAFSLPIGYFPILLPDAGGGAIACWHASTGNLYNSFVQHLAADGTEVFGHNGVLVSTLAGYHHIEPTAAYRPVSGETFVFWNERNSNQDRWGINAQKISAAGTRMWTDSGEILMPVNTIYKGQPRAAQVGDGAVTLFFYEPTGSTLEDQIVAMRVDATGGLVWAASPLVVSSVLSDKGRLPVRVRPDGVTISLWEDDRGGTVDVYGQSVNPDGTLGVPAASAEENGAATRSDLMPNRPNPFASRTEILIAAGTGDAGEEILILDSGGRIVRRLVAAAGARSVVWDGRDDQGRALSSGSYFYRILGRDRAPERGRVVLIRS